MGTWTISLSRDDEAVFNKEIEIRGSTITIKQIIKEAIDEYILKIRSESI